MFVDFFRHLLYLYIKWKLYYLLLHFDVVASSECDTMTTTTAQPLKIAVATIFDEAELGKKTINKTNVRYNLGKC